MNTVIFSNQKGGVGKTTLTRELGIYLSSRGRKMLLVDCDPQGNLTKSLVENVEGGLYEALTGEGPRPTGIDRNLSLLAGDFRLALLEKSLIGEIDAYSRLRDLLDREELEGFDLIFLDTPPSLGVLTVNALTAATHLAWIFTPRDELTPRLGRAIFTSQIERVRLSRSPVCVPSTRG